MSWYLRKSDGAVYGPVDSTALREWAADGRVAPEDSLSEDRASWMPAVDLPILEMQWFVDLDDGSQYGPLNLVALQNLADDGSIPGDSRLTHRKTRESTTLAAALRARPPEPPAAPEPALVLEAVREAAAAVPEPPQDVRQEWKQIAQSRDLYEREAQKWRGMYDAEHQAHLRTEQTMNERLEEMRKSELSARNRIEQLEHKLAHMEKNYELLQKHLEDADSGSPESARMTALVEAYQNVSEVYEQLLGQMNIKSAELQAVIDTRAQVERNAEEQIQQMKELVRREREEADKARHQLANLEEAHLQMARDYRELNDNYIRIREHLSARPAPATDTARDIDEPPDDESTTRVRLNRSRRRQ